MRFLDHVDGRGVDLFRVACERDLEGVAGKWVNGSYLSDPRTTAWVKIKNGSYSQMEGRHELFAARHTKPTENSIRRNCCYARRPWILPTR